MKHTQLFNEFLNESQSFIDESKIGDIHIMAQDADSFTAFRKEFMDEYGKPTSVKELKQLEAWLQTIWKENETNENNMKYATTFEGFISEGKDVFPNEIVGNDQILFKKEWEKMNGGKLAAKYNQYYKGYDIDFGGRIFNTVDQLEKYIKATELSNNQYQKYKYMPEIPIKESVNESTNIKDFFKDPMNLADAKGWVRNLKLSDEEIKTKIKAVMKDPSKFNDLMDAMIDELNLKWK